MKHITDRREDHGFSLTCEHCGDQHALVDGADEAPTWLMAALFRGFCEAHAACKKRKNVKAPIVSRTVYNRDA